MESFNVRMKNDMATWQLCLANSYDYAELHRKYLQQCFEVPKQNFCILSLFEIDLMVCPIVMIVQSLHEKHVFICDLQGEF